MISCRISLLALALSTVACGGSSSSESTTPKVAEPAPVADPQKPMQVYVGEGSMVEFLPLESGQALLRVRGAESKYSNVVFLASRNVGGFAGAKGDHWSAPANGGFLLLFRTHEGRFETGLGRNFPQKLQLDSEVKRDPESFIADYVSVRNDGTLAKLEGFDNTTVKGDLAEASKAVEDACGVAIKFSSDWSAIDKEEVQRAYSCEYGAYSLAALCNDSAVAKATIAAKVKAIDCKVNVTMSASLQSETIEVQLDSSHRTQWNQAELPGQISKLLGLRETVLRSKGGLHIVLPAFHQAHDEVYAGKGKLLHKQALSVTGEWQVMKRPTLEVWRKEYGLQEISAKGQGKWSTECAQGKVELVELAASERDAFLAGVERKGISWQREPSFLARDQRGNYYYVDKMLDSAGGKGFRLYKGPRGAVAPTKLVDIINDDSGMIFSTDKGKLRLINDTDGNAKWIDGKGSVELKGVRIGGASSRKLIYQELGVYDEVDFHTVCELAQ